MKGVQKIDDEMNEILDLIRNEHFNESSKKIIIQKFKKMIFNFRVLKEILDENEFFAEMHDKNINKIKNLSNNHTTLMKESFNVFNNLINKTDNINNNNNNKNNNNNTSDFFIENELIEFENDNFIEENHSKNESIEKINLIPKSISNSSICSIDNKKND